MTFATNDLSENWNRLIELTSIQLSDRTNDEYVKYNLLLQDLRHDREVDGVRLLGLYRAPASKNRHHNVEGGLVRHLLQMMDLWIGMQSVFREHNAAHPLLNGANVWRCILHHDLNKVWKYSLVSHDPWCVDYANHRDRTTTMLGDLNKVIFLLGKHGITLNIPLLNALMTAEGGFSPGPRPKSETVLSKTVYLLDEMSANVIDRLQTNRFWDSRDGGFDGSL